MEAFKIRKGNNMTFDDISFLDDALEPGEAAVVIGSCKIYAGIGGSAVLLNPDSEAPLKTAGQVHTMAAEDCFVIVTNEEKATKTLSYDDLSDIIMDGGTF
jgi:ATP-dependent protease HslVU (ClpYQ) peptidase subunit